MKVFIVGGTGGTGKLIVQEALARVTHIARGGQSNCATPGRSFAVSRAILHSRRAFVEYRLECVDRVLVADARGSRTSNRDSRIAVILRL
jgi:uncharacterized protein YbjT (DUF2867 family)